jgi:diguanylate cyclase (GGDEF)-like protein
MHDNAPAMAFIGKLGRSEDAAGSEFAPPDLEQVVEDLLRARISRLKLPPDIKPLFQTRMRTNTRKTTSAWCVWVGLLILVNTVFDPFMVPQNTIFLILTFRLTLTACLLAASYFVSREIRPRYTPVYLGLPCVLAVLFAGIGGLATHNTGVLTSYLNNAMIVGCTAIMFAGIDLTFCLGICATCLPLFALFLGISSLPVAERLQIMFFDVTAFLAITYGRHVQNLILSRLFLLNMRDEIRDAAARARNALLSSIAYTDPLTEISNRRFFDEICATITENTANLLPVAVCMIDIDHFKKLNDTLGHLQGDRCLKLVAATIRNNLRSPSDIAARFGGEEFVVLFQNTDLNAAYEVAERIRGAIMDLEHPNPGAPAGIVTVSIGVADLHKPPIAIQTLIANADEALYRAKLTGRNRIST